MHKFLKKIVNSRSKGFGVTDIVSGTTGRALLLGGSLLGASAMLAGVVTDNFSSDMTNVLQGASKIAQNGNYTGITMDDLRGSGVLPESVYEEDSENAGSFLYPNSFPNGTYALTNGVLAISGLPQDACIKALRSAKPVAVTTLAVGSTALASTSPTVTQARTACSSATNTVNITIG